MVEAEHSYHQRVAEIFDELLAQMISERQHTESAIPNSNPTPAFVAILSYEKNVKPSNGHQTDEDATKAAAVATKKSYWSKVRTYQLSTHTLLPGSSCVLRREATVVPITFHLRPAVPIFFSCLTPFDVHHLQRLVALPSQVKIKHHPVN
jgi:hypothetical protein